MLKSGFAVACVLLLATASGSIAAGFTGLASPPAATSKLIEHVHSVYGAERSLHARGYYDIRLERPTLPYSFSPCKRGLRYHLHVDYYGDLVQINEIGRCGGYGYARRGYGGYRYDD